MNFILNFVFFKEGKAELFLDQNKLPVLRKLFEIFYLAYFSSITKIASSDI